MNDTSDDPFVFAYDTTIVDREHGIKLSITLGDTGDSFIQINLCSGTLRIPFFLGIDSARSLSHALAHAVKDADEEAQGE